MVSAQTSWPATALHAFSLRMAGHGFSVSNTLMNRDRAYALEQLRCAHTLADAGLRELAMELFRHYEAQPPGMTYTAPNDAPKNVQAVVSTVNAAARARVPALLR